jgi:peroxiredoxin Q/BCP
MGEKSMYGRKYMGVIRSTYLISPDQKIKKVFSPVSVTGHVDEVINFLEENK